MKLECHEFFKISNFKNKHRIKELNKIEFLMRECAFKNCLQETVLIAQRDLKRMVWCNKIFLKLSLYYY